MPMMVILPISTRCSCATSISCSVLLYMIIYQAEERGRGFECVKETRPLWTTSHIHPRVPKYGGTCVESGYVVFSAHEIWWYLCRKWLRCVFSPQIDRRFYSYEPITQHSDGLYRFDPYPTISTLRYIDGTCLCVSCHPSESTQFWNKWEADH
jgi:hypothetical protein